MSLTEEKKPVAAHAWQREIDEHYVEPEWCSRRLIQAEGFIGDIYDPCCGFGTILKAAKSLGHVTYGRDMVDRGYDGMLAPADFLDRGEVIFVDNIICNPPFNVAEKFARRALETAERKVAMIFPTARLNAARWLLDTPLMRVWLMTPRPSMPPGHVIARGEKPVGGKTDFCWLVWNRLHEGPPKLGWLHRDQPTETKK